MDSPEWPSKENNLLHDIILKAGLAYSTLQWMILNGQTVGGLF